MDDMRRSNDLILAQDTFAFIQDGSTGNVEVAVGPFKKAIQDTDKIVIYDAKHNTYKEVERSEAIQPCIKATEGQYVVLTNPEKENKHPERKGQSSTTDLEIGKKIHIPGPCAFPLFPGQEAKVLDGHQLKSNQYLMVRVYNADAAKENIEKSVIITTDESDDKKNKKEKDNTLSLFYFFYIITSKLHVVKGTSVSFFIPPTGVEVLQNDQNDFVRDAVTLERLEYCILLDENGEKDYLKGPNVIFPRPTQVFIEKKGMKKFRAVELNENMGLYIKVIADYEEGNKKYKAGEELFITGKDTKIYYPRPEHQLITYEGQSPIHYATTVPEGEGRYLLDKNSGKIELIVGPKMLLPNPISQVLVRRVLDPRTVNLWFPGNDEAARVNQDLEEINESISNAGRGFITGDDFSNFVSEDAQFLGKKYRSANVSDTTGMKGASGRSFHKKAERTYLKADEIMTEGLERKAKYTKPREILLDTKFSGAVMINVWPGYAVQVVSKSGERRVVKGPKVILLKYDETLEIMSLSTGKPKHDHDLLSTVYLQTQHNVVSDIIDAVTSDFVEVKIRISYRVNFDEASKEKWFNVADYVKLLTQHMRSIIRNSVKKTDIETFNKEAADVIRNVVLGVSEKGKERPGRSFTENGMRIYDIEILGVTIDDHEIDEMLKNAQRDTIENNLEMMSLEKEQELFNKMQEKEANEREKLHEKSMDILAKNKEREEEEKKIKETQKTVMALTQEIKNLENEGRVSREKAENAVKEEHKEKMSEIENKAVKERMEAMAPKLIEALDSLSTVTSTEILAKNLKEYQAAGLFNGESGGFRNLLKTVEGTPLESKLKHLVDKIEARVNG